MRPPRFRDIASYLSKVVIFPVPRVLSDSVGSNPTVISSTPLATGSRVPRLSWSVVCWAVFIEHELVTDGQTYTPSQGHSIYRTSIASHDKNTHPRVTEAERRAALVWYEKFENVVKLSVENRNFPTYVYLVIRLGLTHRTFINILGVRKPESLTPYRLLCVTVCIAFHVKTADVLGEVTSQ